MAILNRFPAILLYCDSTRFFASRCGISGDSGPAILGIVRFATRDSVPLSSDLSGIVSVCSRTECTAVAAKQLRLLTRPENSLADFSHQSQRKSCEVSVAKEFASEYEWFCE